MKYCRDISPCYSGMQWSLLFDPCFLNDKLYIFFDNYLSERGIKEWQLENNVCGRGKDQETEEEEH